MAMSMPSGGGAGDVGVMAAINTTPLVDVMLVLLIIFLITIPVITKQIKVTLPKAVNIPTQTKPENITISVDKDGNVFWNGATVKSQEQLLDLMKAAAVVKPQPEVHIRGDRDTHFESIGRVMYLIQRAGIVKVGFLTEPDHGIRGYRLQE
jgi:biopolymer transport protein ExbD